MSRYVIRRALQAIPLLVGISFVAFVLLRLAFDLVDHAPERDVKGGRLVIPDRPGLGVALVPERVR